jgi:RNA polymerase sigma-70 factor (ECF subfamily)
MPLSTPEIIAELKKGNLKVFESIYHKYFQSLFRYCSGFVRNHEVVEEIVQNCFVSLWLKRESLKDNSVVLAWLFTAVKNQCLNFIRDESKRLKHEIKAEYPFRDIQSLKYYTVQSFVPNELINAELQHIVAEAIETLPEQCRKVFILSRFEELSHKDIGQLLNISDKTIENHITKAIRLLHLKLDPYLVFLLLV